MAREPGHRGGRDREERDSEFVDRLVHINRVAKVVKGGRRFGFETLGMQDVVAKSLGSSNPYNLVRATFSALKNEDSPRSVAARRGLKVSALQSRRRDAVDGEAAGADA